MTSLKHHFLQRPEDRTVKRTYCVYIVGRKKKKNVCPKTANMYAIYKYIYLITDV